MTRNEIQHGMVVVEDTTSNKVVGFLELGMLPPPNSSEQSPLRANALPDTSKMDTNNNPSGSSGSTSSDSSECSEGGIWNEAANTAGAMAAVGALNAPPSPSNDKLEGKDLNGDISAASDNKQKRSPKRSKQPEVAYLANVVVDKNQRRRGIATLMVASAEEIVKALWPDEDRLYVSVEQVGICTAGEKYFTADCGLSSLTIIPEFARFERCASEVMALLNKTIESIKIASYFTPHDFGRGGTTFKKISQHFLCANRLKKIYTDFWTLVCAKQAVCSKKSTDGAPEEGMQRCNAHNTTI